MLIIGPGEYLGDVTAQLVKTNKLMKSQIKAMRITEFTSFFQLTIDHIKEYNAVMIFRNVSTPIYLVIK